MKRFFALGLVVAVICLASCGKKDEKKDGQPAASVSGYRLSM